MSGTISERGITSRPGHWERLLESIRDYHLILQSSLGPGANVQSNIIWHGGEPLLLPAAYFEEVFRLQRDILIPANVEYCNALQTNLYRVPRRTLDVLLQEDVQLGVSFDLVSGVRLGRNGNETEEVVAENIHTLLEQGIRLGAIVVLAGHTARHVRRVYDFYAERELSVRFLPLFDAPLNTPGATFAITERATVDALKRLFDHWIESPNRIAVWPIVEYVYTALLRSRGEIRPRYDRVNLGEWALLVNTDGALYHRPDAYDEALKLGNIFTQGIAEILDSDAYNASLDRDEQLVRHVCEGCRHLGPCGTTPVFEAPRSTTGRRCGVAYPMFRYVDDYFAREGFTSDDIAQVLLEL